MSVGVSLSTAACVSMWATVGTSVLWSSTGPRSPLGLEDSSAVF